MAISIESIQAAYELDQQLQREAVTADDLPLSFDSMTAKWLTAVLCRATPGAKVIGHRMGPVDTGSSNRRRIQIEYNDAGFSAGLPSALFCKASHDLPNRIVLGVSGGAHIETHFYNQIRPLLTIEAPRSFYAHYNADNFNSMIMLGDLTSSVTEFCNHKTEMTLDRAQSQMRLLGKLHGQSFSKPAIQTQLQHLGTWPEYLHATEAFGMSVGSGKGFLAAEEVIPPRLYKRSAEIWPATMRSLELHARSPLHLSHGDVHLKNWYVAGSGEMGLSDWQCASRGHWARDVAYTMSTALTVENRRAWERELISYYLDQLRASGGPDVSFDAGWNAYRQQLITALTWWTITMAPTENIPDMQPKDITLEFIRRISTAMDDLDSLDVTTEAN